MTAHQQIYIEDSTYNIYASTWVRNITSTWEGNVDYSNPWLIEIELVVISMLEGDYSTWTIYDSFDEPDTVCGSIDTGLAVFNRIETKVLLMANDTDIVKTYTIASKSITSNLIPLATIYVGYERRLSSAYGTYFVLYESGKLYVFKNGIKLMEITDTDLGLNEIYGAAFSPKGKYIAVSGERTATTTDGWVILVGT